jgi:hypothetical protein
LKGLGHPRSPKKASGPHQFATILVQNFKELKAMDRYERRTMSRRKFAIRALDVERGKDQGIYSYKIK